MAIGYPSARRDVLLHVRDFAIGVEIMGRAEARPSEQKTPHPLCL